MTEPTACRNNPILRAEHTPLIPPRSGYGKAYGRKHYPSQTVPEYFNYFSAPVALRGRRMRRLLCVLDILTRHGASATGCCRCHCLIQLLHKPSPQHRHSASVCWMWRGHPDQIHVRNVMGVELRRSPLVLRTDPRLDRSANLEESDQSLIGASLGFHFSGLRGIYPEHNDVLLT